MGAFFWLIANVGGPRSLWVYHAWAGGLGLCKKLSKQVKRSKPVGSVPPWPLPQSLPPGSCLGSLSSCLGFPVIAMIMSQINAIFPCLLPVLVFNTAIERKLS